MKFIFIVKKHEILYNIYTEILFLTESEIKHVAGPPNKQYMFDIQKTPDKDH